VVNNRVVISASVMASNRVVVSARVTVSNRAVIRRQQFEVSHRIEKCIYLRYIQL